MDDSTRRTFADLLGRYRTEIVDAATDWLMAEAVDLRTGRPREETRRIVVRAVEAQEIAILTGDEAPLHAFIEFVTSLRAESEFHVSTLLQGMLSFRLAFGPVILREVKDGAAALAILAAVDRVAHVGLFLSSDVYMAKLNDVLLRRRAGLEEELRLVTQAKELELDEKIRTIEAQRAMLNALASPVLRVWAGVLVVPLIGEIDDARSEAVRERVLAEVVATQARVVLVDITGLSVAGAELASELLRLVGCVRLLGADAMLVGVSPDGARALAALNVRLDEVRSFMTLGDGLREALRRTGLKLARA